MKTPTYTREAIKSYEKTLTTKVLRLHREKDSVLIEKINNDPEPYSQLVKRLLKEYYQLS